MLKNYIEKLMILTRNLLSV